MDLSRAVLPGRGVGNHLLWSVGEVDESGRDEHHGEPLLTSEEWSELGVEAVKVRIGRRCL
jgi:hypothetical protein